MKEVAEIGFQSLKRAYLLQRKLMERGDIGEIVERNNDGGDRSTKGDLESEEAVIDFLKEEKFPIKLISEEHGVINITDNPRYLGVLDGFDGSSGLAANPRARGGTMLAIADTLNPRYEDFIFSGLTEPTSEKILYAEKERGATFLQRLENTTSITHLEKRNLHRLNPKTKMYVDSMLKPSEYKEGVTAGMNEIRALMEKTFANPLRGKLDLIGGCSSAAMCLDLVLGYVDLVGQVIAKGVFEPPTQYLLTREIGGAVLGMGGEDIGRERWLEYGRPMSHLLLASSEELGREVLNLL